MSTRLFGRSSSSIALVAESASEACHLNARALRWGQPLARGRRPRRPLPLLHRHAVKRGPRTPAISLPLRGARAGRRFLLRHPKAPLRPFRGGTGPPERRCYAPSLRRPPGRRHRTQQFRVRRFQRCRSASPLPTSESCTPPFGINSVPATCKASITFCRFTASPGGSSPVASIRFKVLVVTLAAAAGGNLGRAAGQAGGTAARRKGRSRRRQRRIEQGPCG